MEKIKKIFVSFGLFITNCIEKVFATELDVQPLYGVYIPPVVTFIRGIKSIISIIVFMVGIFFVFSRKITKKVKLIVIPILFVFAVVISILGQFISNLFLK